MPKRFVASSATITLHKPTADATVGVVLSSCEGITTVARVVDGSLSATAGLKQGQKIVSINGTVVTSSIQGTGIIKAADGAIEVTVQTEDASMHALDRENTMPKRACTPADARKPTPDLPSSPTAVSLPPPRKPLPPHQLILAPMVGGSELAFRLLARRHGAQLCYTPMICCEDFAKSGGVSLLERHVDDSPVVAHFSGNDPQKLLDVARQAERCSGVVAVDLNLGCPQRSAQAGHFGAFLCDRGDRELLLNIVSTLSRSLTVPFFCKIRLLDDLNDTLEFVQQLQDAGCALLAVHGRYRGSPSHRRDGPAHLDQIALIKQKLTIPVITNGNVRNAAELVEALQTTGADGAMSAEAALDDPALFAKATSLVDAERARLAAEVKQAKALRVAGRDQGRTLTDEETTIVKSRKEAKARLKQLPDLQPPPPLSSAAPMPPPPANAAASKSPSAGGAAQPPSGQFDLAEQYITLVEQQPPPGGPEAMLSHSIFHLRRLCRTPLTEYDLLAELKACTSLAACADVMRRCRAYAEGTQAFKGKGRPPSYWKRQQKRGKMR